MIKAIIFDWFGVCAEEFIKHLSRTFKQELILRKTSTKNVLIRMFQDLSINKDANDYLYIFRCKPRLSKEIFELIRNLKGNYQTALLSDNFDDMTKTIR